MGLVIDTSALVAVEREGSDWQRLLADLGDEAVVLPAIVYGELLVGVKLAGSAARASSRRAKIAALLELAAEHDEGSEDEAAQERVEMRRAHRHVSRYAAGGPSPLSAC